MVSDSRVLVSDSLFLIRAKFLIRGLFVENDDDDNVVLSMDGFRGKTWPENHGFYPKGSSLGGMECKAEILGSFRGSCQPVECGRSNICHLNSNWGCSN